MDYKLVFHFLICIASILYVARHSFAFDPSDNYLIDCGSNVSTIGGARSFVADEYLSNPADTLAISSLNSSISFPPYQTARIFPTNSNSGYTFPVNQPGRHWIRFHFFPFAHGNYTMCLANFSVSIQSHHLLANFNTKGPLMKEFSVYLSSTTLVITFTPSNNSFAFVNALEVMSVPESLITDNAFTVNNPVVKFNGLPIQALETITRVNMGGPTVPSYNDTLYRTWVPDGSFLAAPNSTQSISNVELVSYRRGGATQEIAPLIVYGTAAEMLSTNTANVTWEFTVEPGFHYFVRLHFCDLVSTPQNPLYFNVHIDSSNVLPNFHLFDFSGVACYKDFVTAVAIQSSLRVSIAPSTHSRQRNAFLNGVEIMKMNNSMGSLSGVANVESSSNGGSTNNVGLVAGVTVVVLVAVLVVAMLLFWVRRRRYAEHHSNGTTISADSNGTTTSANSNLGRRIPLTAVLEATNNFHGSLVVGAGAFGNVYRGTFRDGTIAAVKRGNPRSQNCLAQFQNEIQMLSQLRHQHLVSLIGYCDENGEKIIIYEYMSNGNLRSHLYGSGLPSLGWKERLTLCIGAAKGLEYLHENAVIHRDVKSTNILVDENLSAKVADLGISKLLTEIEQTHLTTDLKGTFGYLDPEYCRTLHLRKKSDVYSFGVVMFEVLCARKVIIPSLPTEMANLPRWALQWQGMGRIEQIIDPYLVGKIRPLSLETFAETAARCLADIGVHRPPMGEIISNLERALELQDEVLP
ncbi:hypothetical protein LguiB_000863 [Lonicera macranthoides]